MHSHCLGGRYIITKLAFNPSDQCSCTCLSLKCIAWKVTASTWTPYCASKRRGSMLCSTLSASVYWSSWLSNWLKLCWFTNIFPEMLRKGQILVHVFLVDVNRERSVIRPYPHSTSHTPSNIGSKQLDFICFDGTGWHMSHQFIHTATPFLSSMPGGVRALGGYWFLLVSPAMRWWSCT